MNKFYGLNSLRFLAAFGVFVHHVEEIKHYTGYLAINNYRGISALGGICVTAFFVLSGFLLSYLLMKEKERKGTIQVKKFYLRRFLRILPLYYVTLIIYQLLVPALPLQVMEHISQQNISDSYNAISGIVIPDALKQVLLLLLLPHVLLSMGVVFNPAHVWSIGVEEIFYLVWPLLILAARKHLKLFLSTIFLYLACYISALLILLLISKNSLHSTSYHIARSWFSFLYFERISCMAIGAAGAWLYIHRPSIVTLLRRRPVQVITILLLAMLMSKGITLPVMGNELYSILFCIIILNIVSPSENILPLSNRVFEYLGELTYGIYMLSPLAIVIGLELLERLQIGKQSWFTSYIVIYCCTFLTTFLIARISYIVIERPFLKLKPY